MSHYSFFSRPKRDLLMDVKKWNSVYLLGCDVVNPLCVSSCSRNIYGGPKC